MRRILSLLLLAPLAACSSVKPEDLDGFGLVMSSVRYTQDYGEYDMETVVLTNVSGYCRKEQAFQEAYQEWIDANEDAIEGDAEDYCSDMYEPTIAMADEGRKLVYAGANYMSLYVEDSFDDDGYEIGEDIGASVSYITEDPYDVILEDFDEDGEIEVNDDGTYTICGVETEDDGDFYLAEKGDVEVTTAKDEGTAAGSFELDLVEYTDDGDTDDAGELTGSFRASWCDIEWAE